MCVPPERSVAAAPDVARSLDAVVTKTVTPEPREPRAFNAAATVQPVDREAPSGGAFALVQSSAVCAVSTDWNRNRFPPIS